MNLNQIIEKYTKLPKEAYYNELEAKVNAVLPKIAGCKLTLNDGVLRGPGLLATIFVAMMGADGVIDGREANFLTDIVNQLIDKSFTVEDALGQIGLGIIQKDAYQTLADNVIDTIGQVDKQFKEDLVACCVLIALLDGKISDNEKAFLARLIA